MQEVKLSNSDKVRIHFMFNEENKGFAEIAREYKISNVDALNAVEEVEKARSNYKINAKLKAAMRVVYRKRLKAKRKTPEYAKAQKPITKIRKRKKSKFIHKKAETAMSLALHEAGL
ncbi:hypothetical protein MM5_044 [Morganella phage vB_Mm5]